MALRAGGTKRGETPLGGMAALEDALFHLPRPSSRELFVGDDPAIPSDGAPRPSAAHTAAIWITVADTPPLAEQPGARPAARRWLQRLELLESRFDAAKLGEMAGFPGRGDGVPLEVLERAREPLLDRVAASRAWLERLGGEAPE